MGEGKHKEKGRGEPALDDSRWEENWESEKPPIIEHGGQGQSFRIPRKGFLLTTLRDRRLKERF